MPIRPPDPAPGERPRSGLRPPASAGASPQPAVPDPLEEIQLGLPIQEVVRDFLGDLLDRGIAIDRGVSQSVEPGSPHMVGAYRDDTGNVVALVWADDLLAAGMGAALAMVPAASLKAVEQGAGLDDTLVENFREVVNIMSSLLNNPRTNVHLVLESVHRATDDDVPALVWDIVRAPSNQRAFDITIDGYCSGTLGLIAR